MSGTNTQDPCANDGTCLVAPAEFVRMRYFFGQRLGVVDLADEQSYLVGKQRFHNRLAHGAGVLCGLRAERFVFPQGAPATHPTTLLRVRRGAALDACGREIVVGWDQCIDVAAWYAQHPAAHPAAGSATLRLWVALCYRECPSDPAPAPRDPCGCDAGGCEFARIREGFELKLLTDADVQASVPAGGQAPALGGIVPEEVLGGSLRSAYARWVAGFASGDCPGPTTDPCLLLASFQADLDASGQKLVNITLPDNAIPERLSLLATSVLQQSLLEALAAIGDAGGIGQGPSLGAVGFTDAGADSGSLTIEVNIRHNAELAPDPYSVNAQLSVKVFQFKDDGTWVAAPAFTPSYLKTPSRHFELAWAAGAGLVKGRYRVLIENDPAQPVVDALMRPLSPLRWARHVRLDDNGSGTLALADSLYP